MFRLDLQLLGCPFQLITEASGRRSPATSTSLVTNITVLGDWGDNAVPKHGPEEMLSALV